MTTKENIVLPKKNRDGSIDVLRWIALTGIILVHSKPGIFWTQLRNFDVPLMVFLSAVCFGLGGGKSLSNYFQKRFVRLVLPSWIFLTFYFVESYLLTQYIDIRKIVMCYTLTTSWYFWIIRILVGMAVIAPILKKVSERMSSIEILIFSALMFGATELLFMLSSSYLYKVVIMFIPYTSIFLLGMNVSKFSKRNIFIAGIVFMAIYIFIATILYQQSGAYVPTQDYKYPPRLYYVSYSMGASAFLWCFRKQISSFIRGVWLYPFAKFVGSHTFWIYLWHIPFISYMVKRYGSLTTFLVVYFISISITYIQVIVVRKVCCYINHSNLRKNIQTIFIG